MRPLQIYVAYYARQSIRNIYTSQLWMLRYPLITYSLTQHKGTMSVLALRCHALRCVPK